MTNELERYKETLEKIRDTHCGVPGHLVAVGCPSAWLAMMALDPDCHEECSKCGGSGGQARAEWQKAWGVKKDGSWGKEFDLGPVRCEWCRGTGRQMKDHDYAERTI